MFIYFFDFLFRILESGLSSVLTVHAMEKLIKVTDSTLVRLCCIRIYISIINYFQILFFFGTHSMLVNIDFQICQRLVKKTEEDCSLLEVAKHRLICRRHSNEYWVRIEFTKDSLLVSIHHHRRRQLCRYRCEKSNTFKAHIRIRVRRMSKRLQELYRCYRRRSLRKTIALLYCYLAVVQHCWRCQAVRSINSWR